MFPTVLLLLAVLGARAQEPAAPTTPDPLAADTARLAAEVETLRSRAARWDRVLAALPRISGYLQFRCDGVWDGSDGTVSCTVPRARLTFAGDLCPRLEYRLQLDLTAPRLVDAYLDYRPFEQLNVRVGQCKVPFSIENTDCPPTRMELIDYPLAIQRLVGLDEPLGEARNRSTGRDLGILLYGGFIRCGNRSLLGYDVAVLNGAGINAADPNRSKDLTARLTLRPLEGLLLSGSYYWGEYGPRYLRRIRYGAGASYDRGPVVVRGEWIGGRTGTRESAGWYVLAGWRFVRPLTVAVRYDTYRSDLRTADSRQTRYTAGLLWQPIRHLRCQLNYTWEQYAAPGTKDRSIASVALTGMF